MEPVVAAVIDLYRTVHQQFRTLVRETDLDGLNWSPGAEANSIAVLVTHTVASELATLTLVRNVPNERDRDSEFRVQASNAADLLAILDRGDQRLVEQCEALQASDLESVRERHGGDPQLGIHWLVNNYGHAREHLGHAQLTKLLYEQHRR
jgi:hypothetical protein